MPTAVKTRVIIATFIILSMDRYLNMDLISKGAETKLRINSLIQQNCRQIQGYYFSIPLSASDFTSTARHIGTLRSQIETFSTN